MTDLLIIGSSYPLPKAGGSINYVYNVLSGAKPDNISVSILTANKEGESNTEFDKANPFHVYRSKYFYHVLERDRGSFIKRRIYLLLQILVASYYILKLKPKVVMYTEYTFVCLSALLTSFCNYKLGLFTYAEEIQFYMRRRPHLLFLRKLLRKCDIVITVCDYTKDMLCRLGCDETIIKVIIPPIPYVGEYQKKQNTGKETFDILTVGRLEERKGQIQVIEALPEIIKQYPNVRYHIVGGGPMHDSIAKSIEELSLGTVVKMWGRVDDDQLIELYESSDLFIMPHRELPNGDTEGCPTVFLEASYFALPVIGGKAGGVSNAIIDGETGFIIDPQVEMIRETVCKLLEKPSLCNVYGENGHRFSIGYTKDKQSEQFYRIINSCL